MSEWIKTHLPCPKCDSSDAFSINSEGWGKCFSCDANVKIEKDDETMTDSKASQDFQAINPNAMKVPGEISAIPDRKITEATTKKYGVRQSHAGEFQYYPYTSSDGTPVGFKARKVSDKSFHSRGTLLGLFGQSSFPAGGKYVTVTEGELDALAVFQMTGSRYPAVSVKSAQSAERTCKDAYKYLDSFENIVLAFDDDEAGRAATDKVRKLFPIGKVKIMKMSKGEGLKDACDYLREGKGEKFVQDWWRAEIHAPQEIVCGSKLFEKLLDRKTVDNIPYPWKALNDKIFGMRFGEMISIKSPPGVGKTQLQRELIYGLFRDTDYNIGVLALEEPTEVSVEGLMSIHADIPFHWPTSEYSPEEYRKAFDEVHGRERVYYYDSFGNADVDKVLDHIRFMAVVHQCKFIMLDHISLLTTPSGDEDARRAIEYCATELKKLAIELDVCMIVVSHLNKEGGFFGSRALLQLSDVILDLYRNLDSPDEVTRNTTHIKVEKDRKYGQTGEGCLLQYVKETGRMVEASEVPVEVEDF